MTIVSNPPVAPPAPSPLPEPPIDRADHLLLPEVSWDYYAKTVEELMETPFRVNYYRGRMEIMTIGNLHEDTLTAVARLLETYVYERKLRVTSRGSVTCMRKTAKGGLEPDRCYYVITPAPPRSIVGALDMEKVAPPDLVIETDVTNSLVPRIPIYAGLGVKEIWRFEEGASAGDEIRFTILQLDSDRQYQAVSRSLAFPQLDAAIFLQFVKQALATSQTDAIEAFGGHLRQNP